jgi:hypothetical protein
MKYLAVIVLTLCTGACKSTSPSEVAKPADRPVGPATQTAQEPLEKPTQSETIATVDDYIKAETEMFEATMAIFEAANSDCDKLATELSKFADDTKARREATRAYASANPAAADALEAKVGDSMLSRLTDVVMPAATACHDHAGFNAALAKSE